MPARNKMSRQAWIGSLAVIFTTMSCAPIPLPKRASDAEYIAAEKVDLVAKAENYNKTAKLSPVTFNEGFQLNKPTFSATLPKELEGLDREKALLILKQEQAKNLTVKERVQKGIIYLKNGEVSIAKVEFYAILDREPDNKIAKSMLRQIENTPKEYFTRFDSSNPKSYIVKHGDTFSTLAAQFLNNALEFHILAKYNYFSHSPKLVVGQEIKIPLLLVKQAKKSKKILVNTKPKNNKNSAAARIEYTLAKKYYDDGRYVSAIAVLEPRTELHKSDYKAIDLLVLTYTKYANHLVNKANLLEAQTILKKAVSIQPGNKELKKRLAFVKRQREAERQYRNGLAALKKGSRDKAFDAFNSALSLKPDHKMAKKQIVKMKSSVINALHRKAMKLYKNQELELAINNWNKVLKINPDHELARLYRARAVELKERLDKLPN